MVVRRFFIRLRRIAAAHVFGLPRRPLLVLLRVIVTFVLLGWLRFLGFFFLYGFLIGGVSDKSPIKRNS